MIYKTSWINKKGEHLIKIDDFNGKDGVWLDVTEQVYNYTKKVLRDKDIVDVQYTEIDGKKLIDRVTKIQGSDNAESVKTSTTEAPKEHNPAKGTSYLGKAPFDSELSKRQTCMNATASIMQSLVGQVDPNNIAGLMDTIYKKALELINE